MLLLCTHSRLRRTQTKVKFKGLGTSSTSHCCAPCPSSVLHSNILGTIRGFDYLIGLLCDESMHLHFSIVIIIFHIIFYYIFIVYVHILYTIKCNVCIYFSHLRLRFLVHLVLTPLPLPLLAMRCSVSPASPNFSFPLNIPSHLHPGFPANSFLICGLIPLLLSALSRFTFRTWAYYVLCVPGAGLRRMAIRGPV